MRFVDYILRSERTHKDLARQLGVSRSMITQIVAGTKRPSLQLCRRVLIATQGQVTADDLIDEFTDD